MVHDRLEPRGVAADLRPPVGDDAGGAGDQERRGRHPLLDEAGHDSHGLEGLAQAHVVAQQAAEPVLPEEAQPFGADPLIGPERRPDPVRLAKRLGRPQLQQALEDRGAVSTVAAAVSGNPHRPFRDRLQPQQLACREADPLLPGVVTDELLQVPERRGVEVYPAAGDLEVGEALLLGVQDLGQRHPLAAEAVLDGEPPPAPLQRLLEVQLRGGAGDLDRVIGLEDLAVAQRRVEDEHPFADGAGVVVEEARHLMPAQGQAGGGAELPLVALPLQLGQHPQVLEPDEAAVPVLLDLGHLEELLLAGGLEGADHRPDLDGVQLGRLADVEDGAQGDGADRQVLLVRPGLGEERQGGLHAVTRHGDLDHRLATVDPPPEGEGEGAGGLVDGGVEAAGLLRLQLADAVIGEPVPEALLPGVAVRLHPCLEEKALLRRELKEDEPFQQLGAVEDAGAERHLAGALQEA